MVTIKDIAKRAGVSPATVSYVLNGTRFVSAERKERVLQAVKELNYVPNAVARGLRVKETRTLGLVLSDITNPFYPDLAKACEDTAQSLGYKMIMMNTYDQADKMNEAVSQIREGKVDGLIIASALMRDREQIISLTNDGYPIVLAHRRIPGLEVDTVVADNFNGSYNATRHLLSLGHKYIAMITGIEGSYTSTQRIEGYKKALNDAGIRIPSSWMMKSESKYELSYSCFMNVMQNKEGPKPTAIIAGSDIAALGVLDAAEDLGMDVPRDLAVIGFNDLFVASIRSVQLTTVRIPRYDIGHHATRVLVDRIRRNANLPPVDIVLPTPLIIRRTCGASITTQRSIIHERVNG